MKVKDVMKKRVITCTEDELISRVLSKMRKNNIHQVFVTQKDEIKGAVVLNEIIRRNFDPESTKASGLSIPIPTTRSSSSIEEAAELLLASNLRAIPVVDDKLVGVISENDIVSVIEKEFDVNDVSNKCGYVSEKDNLGDIQSLMVKNNFSRVPVVEKGEVIGIVGTMELANVMEQRSSLRDSGAGYKSRTAKEKITIDESYATTAMRNAVIVRKPVVSKKVLELLKTNEEVLIVNGEIRIITPKDILRLVSQPKKKLYFQISGLEDEDSVTIGKIHKTIEKAIIPIAKANEIQPLHMHIEHNKKYGGGKTRYEVKAQLPTQIGVFVVSKVQNYNLITATQEAMDNLSREFWSKYEKLQDKKMQTKRAKKRR